MIKQPIEEKENSEFKTILFWLKNDLVSHAAHSQEVGQIHTHIYVKFEQKSDWMKKKKAILKKSDW